MPAFGDFETVGEPLASTEERSYVATVWKAKRTGTGDKRSYVIKSYAPRRAGQESAAEEDLEHDGGLRFAEGIKDLRKARQQGGQCLAEVHDLGVTPEGVWYVTDFCPRTLEQFIALRGRLDAEGLRNVVGSVVAGCLSLKRARGFSHGNLKTRNVFLVGAPRALRKTAIQLGDPYPAGGQELSRLEPGDRSTVGELIKQTAEAQDLRAIGELIYQLVEGRVIRRDDINYPVRDSNAWKVLGKEAERLRDWCNRLLDPNLTLAQMDLKTLALEFRPTAGPSALPRILAVVAVVGLVAGAAYLIPRWLPTKLVKVPPTAGAINYGQTLAEATLTGGVTAVPGTFTFAQPTIAPHAGVSEQSLTFTPADTSKQQAVSVRVKVTVNKALPRILTLPTASELGYGQKLQESVLTGGGGSVPGAFAFAAPTTAPPVGTGEQPVEFAPADTADYNSATAAVKVTVVKAKPVIKAPPTASDLTYGQVLASSTLYGGSAANPFDQSPVAGRFEYVEATRAPKAGQVGVDVRFTPADAADYDPVGLVVNVQVNVAPTKKSTPTIAAAPTASDLTYGQTLADSTLSGGSASTGGQFSFTTPSAAPRAGTTEQNVTFTPTDLTNFNRVDVKVRVKVNKATPRITTEPQAATITYGQTLADSGISGGEASTPGKFAFTTPTSQPKVGVSSQSVSFTPADLADYNAISLSVNVRVNPYPVLITQTPTASPITFGQALGDSTLSGGAASTPGTFAWTTPTVQPKAGRSSQGVTFTPTDATDYNPATNSVTVVVNQATPQVTQPPTASPIASGQTLADSRLSGGAVSTAGTFVWTSPALQPRAGTSAQSVSFLPRDATDYLVVTSLVSVTVGKVNLQITAEPTAGDITYGQKLSSSTLSGGKATTDGTFTWASPEIQPKAGVSPQSVTFTPTDLANFNPATVTVKVTVGKATPQILTAPTAGVISNGQTLASAVLSGGKASTAGTFAWTTPATRPPVGTSDQSVTFIPEDENDFKPVGGTTPVTVQPIDPHPPLGLFGMDFVWVKGIHGGQGAYVEKTELSQGQFKANGGATTQTVWKEGEDYPVNVTYGEAVNFCNGLNKKQASGSFALPARKDFLIYAGADAAGSENPSATSLTNRLRALGANTRVLDPNARSNTLGSVKDGRPNDYGLINVLGNAWEWCDNGGTGVPAGWSFASSGFGPSKWLFADQNPPSPDNDVLGVRLVYLPAAATP